MYIRSEKQKVAGASKGAQQNGSKCASTLQSAATTASQEQGTSAGGDEQEVLLKNRAPETSFWRTGGWWGRRRAPLAQGIAESLGTDIPAQKALTESCLHI